MKKLLKQFSQILGTSAFLLAAMTSLQTARAGTKTNAAPTVDALARKSVFEDNINSGKDPFFPKSTRRVAKAPTIAAPVASPITQLSLKGISGPTNRRFALINNQPLAAGEDGYVRISSGQVKVHCWEIREDSAVVSVEGDPVKKELRLRDSL